MTQTTMTPGERYRRDPAFKAIVDTFEAALHAAQFTPTEIREAAMLAAIHYDMRRLPERIGVLCGEVIAPGREPGSPPDMLIHEGLRYYREGRKP